MRDARVDALVLAGGRISGAFAQAAGTKVKALVSFGGRPLVSHVARALAESPGIGRIAVVGPEAVCSALSKECVWVPERDSAQANLLAGAERVGADPDELLLACGADVPLLSSLSLQDFLARTPPESAFAIPVIRRERFRAAFPGDRSLFVPMREGAFTGGSMYMLRPRFVQENLELVRQLRARRKSHLAMARLVGLDVVWKLLSRRATVAELEARALRITGHVCRAVLDCGPDLAYDVDNLSDLRYLEQWAARRSDGEAGGASDGVRG